MSDNCFQCPPADPVICDPIIVFEDYYYPQIVPIVHTVKVVKRNHCVPVPKHIYNCITEEQEVNVSGYTSKKAVAKVSQCSKKKTKKK
ncbi:hypothetical protein [Paenibacillus sp. IHBB 10380]|uniref:hypothetical protein n=1 Tax=Paenibacillus sp. IHBB 10380 TaxID=1566358 RepID=UPI0005CF9A2F|nr:hypothetical protein [Paenibacillus sp. IHBB 10380]AJS57716.1 hypothetical protein UB51_03525 [Paenibacillus sp. IHBB 10380]